MDNMDNMDKVIHTKVKVITPYEVAVIFDKDAPDGQDFEDDEEKFTVHLHGIALPVLALQLGEAMKEVRAKLEAEDVKFHEQEGWSHDAAPKSVEITKEQA